MPQEAFSRNELDKIKHALTAYRQLVLDGKETGNAEDLKDLIDAVEHRIPKRPPQ
jgi:hypothetical protein